MDWVFTFTSCLGFHFYFLLVEKSFLLEYNVRPFVFVRKFELLAGLVGASNSMWYEPNRSGVEDPTNAILRH